MITICLVMDTFYMLDCQYLTRHLTQACNVIYGQFNEEDLVNIDIDKKLKKFPVTQCHTDIELLWPLMVTIVGSSIGNLSSNPRWDCCISLYANVLGKGMKPSVLLPTICK